MVVLVVFGNKYAVVAMGLYYHARLSTPFEDRLSNTFGGLWTVNEMPFYNGLN